MNNRISIHVATKDRATEVALMLQSLRTQTFQDFDLILYDDCSGTPIINNYFISYIINRLKLEGHYVKTIRGSNSFGVCNARQCCIDEDLFENEYCCRLDDDVILEPDYLQKLLDVINAGYDMASGIVPLLGYPELEREVRFVKPVIDRIEFNEFGDITYYGDDCGYAYIESEILPAHHFRTNLLYKSEINKKVFYEKGLSPVGFREESFFSIRAAYEGYKLGVHIDCKSLHIQCPSGGCRYPNYSDMVRSDDLLFRKWVKNKFLSKGNPFEVKQ